jgi:CHAD domain-containing protein
MPDRSGVLKGALATLVPAISEAATRLRESDDRIRTLHQLRVSLRRLRATLRTFDEAFDLQWRLAITNGLRPLTKSFGEARDLDVFIGRVGSLGELIDPADDAEFAALLAHFEGLRDDAYARVTRAVRSRKWQEFDAQLAAPPPLARVRVGVVRTGLRRQWRQVADGAQRCHEQPDEAELHHLRIAVKRLRYSLEAAAPLLGSPALRHARRLARVQDALGLRHDRQLSQSRLRRASIEQPTLSFVAGQLITYERVASAHDESVWWERWKQASEPQLLEWRK